MVLTILGHLWPRQKPPDHGDLLHYRRTLSPMLNMNLVLKSFDFEVVMGDLINRLIRELLVRWISICCPRCH